MRAPPPPPLPATRRAAFPRGLLLLVLVAALLARASSLRDGFLNYDDREVRQEAAAKGLGEVWTKPFYYAYKPVYGTSVWVDERLFGDDPHGWHGASVVLFALACALAALVAHGVTGSTFVGAGVGLLLATHPVHAENVSWVAERKDLLSLVLVLLAHLAWRRARARGERVPWGAVALLVLGGLAKGTVWTYAGVIALDDAILGPAPGRARRLTALLGAAAGGIVLDAWVGATMGPGSVRHDATPGQLIAAMAGVHARYVATLLWPTRLSIDHPVDPAGSFSDPWAVAGLVLAAVAVVGLIVGLSRRRPVLALSCGLWVLGLLPVNNVWPTTAVLRADRYLLVPALGAYLALSALLARRPLAGGTALAGLVGVLGLLADARGPVFAEPETAWTDAVAAEPGSAVAWFLRGVDRQERSLWPGTESDAREAIEAARALRRPELVVRGRLLRSLALLRLDRVDEALEEADDAVRGVEALAKSPWVRDPGALRAEAHARVAQALKERGQRSLLAGDSSSAQADFGLAIDEYRRAVQADPSRLDAQLGLGSLLGAAGGDDALREATAALDRAWRLAPGDPIVAVPYVTLLYKQGRDAEAKAIFAETERRRGGDRDLLLLRAKLKAEGEHDPEAAAADYRTLIARDAHDTEARARLAALRRRQGGEDLAAARTTGDRQRLVSAVERADQALAVDPSDAEAQTLAGDALFAQGRFHDARDRYARARALEPAATWRGVLEARAGTYEAAALLHDGRQDDGARAMAAVVRAAPPRVDLGFAILEPEIAWLAPAAAALEEGKAPESLVAAGALRAAALLAVGDDGVAEAEAGKALAALGSDPPSGSGLAAVSDAALLLRALARARRLDLAAARTDLGLLASRRPGDALVVHHQLLLDRQEALARVRIAAAAGGEAIASAKARAAEVAARCASAADRDAPWPGPGLLAVETAMEGRDWVAALRRLDALRKRFPTSADVLRGEADVYQAQSLLGGDRRVLLEEARTALQEAKAIDPRDPRTALALSQWYRLAGNLKAAAVHAMEAAAAEPVPGAASRTYAALLVEIGRRALGAKTPDFKKAHEMAAASRAVDVGGAAPEILEGDAWRAQHELDKALAAYLLAREKEPASKDAITALAACRRERGSAYFLWRLKYPEPAAKNGVPPDLDHLRDWREKDTAARRMSVEEFRAALRLESDGPEADGARERLTELERLDPALAHERSSAADKAYEAGEALRRKGDLSAALEQYREATGLFPDHLPAWMRIAEASVELGSAHDVEGLRAIERVRDLDADGHWPEPDLYLGEILARRAAAAQPGAAERARRALDRFLARTEGLGAPQEANRARARLLRARIPEGK